MALYQIKTVDELTVFGIVVRRISRICRYVRGVWMLRRSLPSRLQKLLLGVLVLAAAGYLPAEIAPENYAGMQDDAAEYVTIEPTRVRKGFALPGRSRPVTVNARVISVFRSATGIAVDDTITISYEHVRPRRGWVGPRPIPILKTGRRYPAYLAWDPVDATFRPAAMGASFEFPAAGREVPTPSD